MHLRFYFTIIMLSLIALCGCRGKHQAAGNSGAYYRRGVAAYQRGEYEKAVNYFEKAIVLSPDDPDPYLAAAEIYDDYLGNKTLARERYLRFIALTDNEVLKAAAIGWLGEETAEDASDTPVLDQEQIYRANIEQMNRENRDLRLKVASAAKRIEKLKSTIDQQRKQNRIYRLGRVALIVVPIGLVLQFAMIVYFRSKPRRSVAIPRQDEISEIPIKVSGKYLIIADRADVGSVNFEPAEEEVDVTCCNDRDEKISSGRGKLERDAIDVELTDNNQQQTIARFEFHDHGTTFTAAWRSPSGTTMAVGIKQHGNSQ